MKQKRTKNMMRGFLLSTFLLVDVGGAIVRAVEHSNWYPVVLQVKYDDPTKSQSGNPRMPIGTPSVTIDDHTLDVSTVWFNATLQLLDEDGNMVYTTLVPAYTSTVTLPSNIDGTLQIQFLWNNWCFYGWITLYASL